MNLDFRKGGRVMDEDRGIWSEFAEEELLNNQPPEEEDE
tara:strand:+ start:420 stop:536 length:117 start_codon:yes stop_codon:yes gene_type:complete